MTVMTGPEKAAHIRTILEPALEAMNFWVDSGFGFSRYNHVKPEDDAPVPELPEISRLRIAMADQLDWMILDAPPTEHPSAYINLIGLGGLLRSGKDTVADRLVDAHGYAKVQFSEALADALYNINPWIPEGADFIRYQRLVDAVGYVEAKTNPEVRSLLMLLGTEVGRDMVGENVWTDIIADRIGKHRANGFSVAVTGVRFRNELEMMHSLGGTTIWVDREQQSEVGAGHASENSVQAADFDLIIDNRGALDDLYDTVDHKIA